MSFLLLRTPPSAILLAPRAVFRTGLGTAGAAAHISSPILRQALKPKSQQLLLVSPLSTWRPTTPAKTPQWMAHLFRSKAQQLVLLRRQYATFGKKDPLVPSSKPAEKGGGVRLLERLKHRGRISDLDTPPALTNVCFPPHSTSMK